MTLYGVVIIDGERTAYLLEGAQEGRPRKVRENESFAGGVVKTIRPDGVTVLFSGSEIDVPLRTPKPAATAPRGQEAGGASPRPETPAAFPRRQLPTAAQQSQKPAPGRPAPAASGMPIGAPGMPAVMVPDETGVEAFGDEEFPEAIMPGEEAPGMPEDEVGE